MMMTDAAPGAFRQRLLEGLAASIEERGYGATKIDDIVRFAKTSKRTFYAEFASKKECYLELLEAGHETMRHSIVAAVDATAPWRTQIGQAVAAYLESVETHPALILSGIRDLPTIDANARALQRKTMDSMIEMLFHLGDVEVFHQAGIAPLSRPAAILLLGGLRELVATAIEDGTDLASLADVMAQVSIAVVELQHVANPSA